jgi:hypothetical protein
LPVTWLVDRGVVRGKIVGEATPEVFLAQGDGVAGWTLN